VDQRTLILGSGNSTLGEEMYEAGWTNITSIDFSDVAIESAQQRAPHMEWRTMDATELSKHFAPGSFDLVIDKGLLDSMHLVGDRGKEPIEQIAKGIQKVLAPGTGRFVWLSLSSPSVWSAEHAELTECGWGSTEARRLEASYLYVYCAREVRRMTARLGVKRRRR
jgi:2-polyprenyl-3-methyl-5-hydroxy-6-metoxy-1,4-benzoquinol methylase